MIFEFICEEGNLAIEGQWRTSTIGIWLQFLLIPYAREVLCGRSALVDGMATSFGLADGAAKKDHVKIEARWYSEQSMRRVASWCGGGISWLYDVWNLLEWVEYLDVDRLIDECAGQQAEKIRGPIPMNDDPRFESLGTDIVSWTTSPEDHRSQSLLVVKSLEPQWFTCHPSGVGQKCSSDAVFAINSGPSWPAFAARADMQRRGNLSQLLHSAKSSEQVATTQNHSADLTAGLSLPS